MRGLAVIICLSVTAAYGNRWLRVGDESPLWDHGPQGSSAPKRCATHDPSPQQMDNIMSLEKANGAGKGKVAFSPATISVFFHIITDSSGQGAVTNKQLSQQINVLNTQFAASTLTFALAATDKVVNDDWFRMEPDSQEEENAKSALRQGGAEDLNVYLCGNPNLLGWATYPNEFSNTDVNDGVVINYATLPGGSMVPYNLGNTLTHETGHWLNLFHTFKGGCSGENDRIADTPAERKPAFGCPIGRNTCRGPTFPGNDPVTNFMDYSDDLCMKSFTPNQINRMQASWTAFRHGK